MTDIKVVAVTGASGFIGAHIVQVCLERGYKVHACVRDKADSKNKFLLDMAKHVGGGQLELFSTGLLKTGSYDQAFALASGVIHAAAVLAISDSQDPQKDMVDPSTQGTLNVLSSVESCGVQHFVYTSSVAAIVNTTTRGAFTEADWSDAKIQGGGISSYNYAKAEGERVVWRHTKGKPYTVSCINPTMVLGQCLSKPHAKASPYIFRQALYGNAFPNSPVSVVDVRDVAIAHVEAMIRPEADRKRFILDGDDANVPANVIIEEAARLFPQYKWKLSDGPAGRVYAQPFDNSLSKKVLGMKYAGQEHVIRVCVESMVDSGWVPTQPASKL